MTKSLVGQVLLEQFRVDAFVAAGGMGVVYRVWDLKRNAPLAMKVLHADLAEDPSIFKRFKREARALQKLAHPNIVPFFGLFQTGELAFLVERFVDGPSLSDILRQMGGQPLSSLETLTYLKAVSAALGYAHVHGVVHCDVKPGNVMVDRGGNIFLTDFGIARHAESSTTTLGFAGSPSYMAPEQILGEPVTSATDVYSLGILLFELLTGRRPFRGDQDDLGTAGQNTNERIRYGHLKITAPDPRSLNPEIPDSLSQVVRKALAKRPEDRFQDIHQMYLTACTAMGISPERVPERVDISQPDSQVQEPGTADIHGTAMGVPQAQTITPRARTQRRTGIWLAGALGLVIMAAIATIFVFRPPFAVLPATPTRATVSPPTQTIVPATSTVAVPGGGSEEEPSVTPTSTETQSPTAVPTTDIPTPVPSATSTPTLTPTTIGGADRIAFLDRGDIWVAGLDGSNLVQLTEDGAEKSNLQWTPDGKAVVYTVGRCIQSAEISTGRIDSIACFETAEFLEGLAISRDGQQIAISLNRELYVVPFDRERLSQARFRTDLQSMATCEVLAPYAENAVKTVQWSQDGTRLAIVFLGAVEGLLKDLIRLIDISDCNRKPPRLDEFPIPRFTMKGYNDQPTIEHFGWDGGFLFVLNGFIRNDGYGDLYIYNGDTYRADLVNPIDNICCYRDASWSPDGRYLIFAFQDIRLGSQSVTEIYIIQAGTLGTGLEYDPLPLPAGFFSDPRVKPQPVLRPAP